MNERIKVLKRQAEEYAAEYGTEHCVFGQELIDVLDAKFAELIVSEYAELCEKSGYEFGTIFAKMGKAHFGIE